VVNVHDKYKQIGNHNRIRFNKIPLNNKSNTACGIDKPEIFYISENKGNSHQKRSDIPYPFNRIVIHKVLNLKTRNKNPGILYFFWIREKDQIKTVAKLS